VGRVIGIEDVPEKFRTLPAAAQSLLDLATSKGWLTACVYDSDSGGSPFVQVALHHPETHEQFTMTWHTRATGTYRLFSKLWRQRGRAVVVDAPSIKKIRELVEGANQ
jgi:hypothetical protein